jgi:predicted ATP-binding protein involved in virulence
VGRKKPEHKNHAYFLSLTVENIRCFGEKQTLDLSDGKGNPAQWTILLGNNGMGKTTLLQCLSLAGESVFYFTNRRLVEFFDKNSHKNEEDYFLLAEFCRKDNLFENKKDDSNFDISIRKEKPLTISTDEVLYYGYASFFLCGYGTHRQIREKSLAEGAWKDPIASLFSDDVVLENPEEWLLKADYVAAKAGSASARKKAAAYQEKVRGLLINLLPEVEDLRVAGIDETPIALRVEFQTPFGWVGLRDLSLGYKTLIAWIVDLARRLDAWYPKSANPLAEPAVVLVDEIDLHMHPRWQRTIMRYLSERFPNVQFVVTAHSPLIVQSNPDANVAVLRREGDHVVIDNNPHSVRGWRIDQILTSDLFGLESARSLDTERLLKQRREILSKAEMSSEDEERLRRIDGEIGELPTAETQEDIKMMEFLRSMTEKLKKESEAS